MRDLQLRCVDGRVVVEKNIEVDQAWALGEGFLAAHLGFYFPQGAEQCRGRKTGLCFEDGVEEPGLVEIVDGLRFVDAGSLEHLDRGMVQAPEGFAEIFLAFPDVGPEGKIDGGHAQFLF